MSLPAKCVCVRVRKRLSRGVSVEVTVRFAEGENYAFAPVTGSWT